MSDKWYKEDGIFFGCTGCGGCCSGSPGYVWLSDDDIERLAKHLKIDRTTFLKKYTRSVGNKVALLEDPKNYDCVFLKDQKMCSVYSARPKQCKTYPFWPSIFSSQKNFDQECKRCEGINSKDAKHYSFDEIEENLKS